MSLHRYILEPYKGITTRHDCPQCGHRRTFVLYIDTENGNIVGPEVGRCNRESNCGYHYAPKQYFQDYNFSFETTATKQIVNERSVVRQKTAPKPISFIPGAIFKQSLREYETNHFVQFLLSLFDRKTVNNIISSYYVGTSKEWLGATVFWQIDRSAKLRTGKIMLYNAKTGKRVKEPYNFISWVHSVLELPDFNLQQCLFGEHLLKDDHDKPVAIVESEKTAIIASIYLPQFIWLACGSLNNLSTERFAVLKGRTITLYPDINGFDKWKLKAEELSRIAKVSISDLLETKSTPEEKKGNLDIADYLIRFPVKDFIQTTTKKIVSLSFRDIKQILPCIMKRGEEYGRITIIDITTDNEQDYSLLFDANGEPIETSRMRDTVLKMAEFYEMKLISILLEGVECWGSIPYWVDAHVSNPN